MERSPTSGLRFVIFVLSFPAVTLALALGWMSYEIHHLLRKLAFKASLEVAGDIGAAHTAEIILVVASGVCAGSALAAWVWCLVARTRNDA